MTPEKYEGLTRGHFSSEGERAAMTATPSLGITGAELRTAFGDHYRTLQEVAWEFGVSREYIRQLVTRYGIPLAAWRRQTDTDFDSLSPSGQLHLAPRSRWPREGLPAFKRQHGFCEQSGCRVPAARGRHMCAAHLQEMRERARERQDSNRAKGLCLSCGRPPAPGRSSCQMHLDSMRAWARTNAAHLQHYRQEQRAKRVQLGLCLRCGGTREDMRWLYCKGCRADARVYNDRRTP